MFGSTLNTLPVNHKNKQTIYDKEKPHGSFNTDCISVFNYWKTLQTTLLTQSDNLPTKLTFLYHPSSTLVNNLMFFTK